MKMKEGFLWGGSVSAHQTEGASTKEYGKGESIYDYFVKKGFGDFSEGIDFYHQYKEDIQLLKELGINSYRFSISWSRLFPQSEDELNAQGVDFYNKVIDELIKQGIEPIVCLYHFDTPLYLQTKHQGWLGRETVEAYRKYVLFCIETFGDRVKYWIPMNEQNGCAIVGLLSSAISTEADNFELVKNQITHNQAVASAYVHRYVKEYVDGGVSMGMIVASPAYPASSDPQDVFYAHKANASYNYGLLDILVNGEYPKDVWKRMEDESSTPIIEDGDMELLEENKIENIGLSYYASFMTGFETKDLDTLKNTLNIFQGGTSKFKANPYLKRTEWEWTIDHTGLRIVLNDVYNRYRLPIYVLESGVGVIEQLDENLTVNDDYRIEYLGQQIQAVKDAVNLDYVDVKSYLTWGPIDILSSQGEMKKRYGFIYVNRNETELLDLKRYKKKSFDWFRKVIESNGETL